MLYSNNVVPLHVPITTVIRERSRSQTVVKNYGHQLRRHPESEMNQRTGSNIRLNGRYQQIKGKGHVVPHFLYNARTKNFFEYDCYNNSINKHKIISSNNIIKYIRKRL